MFVAPLDDVDEPDRDEWRRVKGECESVNAHCDRFSFSLRSPVGPDRHYVKAYRADVSRMLRLHATRAVSELRRFENPLFVKKILK